MASPNVFLTRPYLMSLDTKIIAARSRGDGQTMLALEQTVVRGAGGGQPSDSASVTLDGVRYTVSTIEKEGGRTWLGIPGLQHMPETGRPIRCEIDGQRRRALTRSHSLTHLLMASIRWTVPGYRSRGADIAESAHECLLRFDAEAVNDALIGKVDAYARAAIARAVRLNVLQLPSIEQAIQSFPHWRVDPSLTLGGRVRVIEIGEGIDANPCSGTHVENLAEIGEFSIEEVAPANDEFGFELRARIAAA